MTALHFVFYDLQRYYDEHGQSWLALIPFDALHGAVVPLDLVQKSLLY